MKANHSEIVFILDMTGSMHPLKMETVENFNKFLNEQKKVPGTAKMSLITFNSKITDWVFDRVDLSEVKELTIEKYNPQEWTPLLDTISDVIDRIGKKLEETDENERPQNIIVAILTDGEENFSRKITREELFKKITHQTEVYKWNFIFMGANQDSFLQAGKLGISNSTTINFDATANGIRSAYTYASTSTSSMRSTSSKNSRK